MYRNSNWPNRNYCNTSSSNNHEPYFQVTTNESNGYNPITPTESIASTDKAHSKSRKRQKRTEDKVLSIKKESICKKHASHATLEEQKRCEEKRIRNRIASHRSRQKKFATINKQREEIDQLKFVLSQKDELINQIVRRLQFLESQFIPMNRSEERRVQLKFVLSQKDELINQIVRRLQFLESQFIPMNKQQTYEIKQNVRENHMMEPLSQQSQNMAINAGTMEAIEAGKYSDNILEDMNKMDVVDIDIQNALDISTPILKQAVQHVLNVPLTNPLNQVLDQQNQAKPPLIVKKDKTTIQYAPKPGSLILEDGFEHNPAKYHSPLFQKIVHQFYGESPIKLVNPVTSTSDAEINDVEKVDEEKVTNSVKNVSNMMQNATINQEPIYFNSDMMNLLRMVPPEFDREVHNILNAPLTSPLNQDLDQQNQAKPPLIVKKDKTTIQYFFKPSEPILEESKKFNEERAESELEQPAENEEEENNEDEYEPRPDCLCLGDDEEGDQDELEMSTPGTVTVSVKETVINSPIFRMKIHSFQSTSPIQYRTLTNK
uniref:BZIP domain-containing protein n=1 Tax=Acrobeloides nanus TaxID=290746 RepID=A0A914CGM5_9BILA